MYNTEHAPPPTTPSPYIQSTCNLAPLKKISLTMRLGVSEVTCGIENMHTSKSTIYIRQPLYPLRSQDKYLLY